LGGGVYLIVGCVYMVRGRIEFYMIRVGVGDR
jgi:hypothetical protein